MRIILVAILATLMGCAATVPKAECDMVIAGHKNTYKILKNKYTEVKKELGELKPTEQAIEAAEYERQEETKSTEALEVVLNNFIVEFANAMTRAIGQATEIKADEITFADNYEFAIVRVWIKFPAAMGKYYIMFTRDENDLWEYIGYHVVNIISLTGDRQMKNFEEILEEGKSKAKTPENTTKRWRDQINLLMEILHSLNDMYGTANEHQVKVKTSSCKGCKRASFVIAIRDITRRDRIMKFHRGRWTVSDKGVYYCDKCKKGK